MRIIGGIYKSRLIELPRGVNIRPTQDKVRQAVFNILGDLSGGRVLDLFAGSGAFGIEAISRGAEHVTFVDSDPRCLKSIKTSLESLNIDSNLYNIIRGDGVDAPLKIAKSGQRFNLIILDPPYYEDLARKCLINIDSCDILAQSGVVVTEHFMKDSLDFDSRTLFLLKDREYGDTKISIFKKEG